MIKSKVILESKKALTIIYKKYCNTSEYLKDMLILSKQFGLLWNSIEMFTYNVSKKKYILVSALGEYND